jgi:hypothetical protein
MLAMLEIDPLKRISVEEALQHPYFAGEMSATDGPPTPPVESAAVVDREGEDQSCSLIGIDNPPLPAGKHAAVAAVATKDTLGKKTQSEVGEPPMDLAGPQERLHVHRFHSESLNNVDIERLATKMWQSLEVKDRSYHLKVYEKCFVGSDAVDWLRKHVECSEREALSVGNMMITANIFHHVVDGHWLKNDALFYRFTADEDSGAHAALVFPDEDRKSEAAATVGFATNIALDATAAPNQTLTQQHHSRYKRGHRQSESWAGSSIGGERPSGLSAYSSIDTTSYSNLQNSGPNFGHSQRTVNSQLELNLTHPFSSFPHPHFSHQHVNLVSYLCLHISIYLYLYLYFFYRKT